MRLGQSAVSQRGEPLAVKLEGYAGRPRCLPLQFSDRMSTSFADWPGRGRLGDSYSCPKTREAIVQHSPYHNELLARLPAAELAAVEPLLESVDLPKGFNMALPEQPSSMSTFWSGVLAPSYPFRQKGRRPKRGCSATRAFRQRHRRSGHLPASTKPLCKRLVMGTGSRCKICGH